MDRVDVTGLRPRHGGKTEADMNTVRGARETGYTKAREGWRLYLLTQNRKLLYWELRSIGRHCRITDGGEHSGSVSIVKGCM